MISNPTIPVLQRREVLVPNPTDFTFDSVSFKLKRSGKVMRKVDSSPPIYSRTWKPVEENTHCDNNQTIEEGLAGVRLVAETLYVAKPIVHLASVGLWGNNAWKPWMASLLLDVARYNIVFMYRRRSLIRKLVTFKQRIHCFVQDISKNTAIIFKLLSWIVAIKDYLCTQISWCSFIFVYTRAFYTEGFKNSRLQFK